MNNLTSNVNLPGFDPQFTDICDYIIRITYQIWEGKQVDLCFDYYSADCPVYTLTGVTFGAEEVTNNTRSMQQAFPDRTLAAVNIVWGGDAQSGFHTSHLIDTQMTSKGHSEFGPATGRQARALVIAHCVVKENRIIEEWLVRDNYSLAQQFGVDPLAWVEQTAQTAESSRLTEWRLSELERLDKLDQNWVGSELTTNRDDAEFLTQMHQLWCDPSATKVAALYADNASLHAPKGELKQGRENISNFFTELHDCLSDTVISFDYFADQAHLKDAPYRSIRWTMSGKHTGGELLGQASQAKVLIIGECQYRLEQGRIAEEWCVFDLLGTLLQIERLRLKA